MTNFFPSPILADIGEVIGALVTLVALFFWIIQKVAEATKGQQARQPRQEARPQVEGGAAGPAAGQQADPLREQVEEFLRRANQGNQANQGAGQPQRAAPVRRDIEVLIDDAPPERPRRVVGAPLESMTPQLAAQPPGSMAGDKRPIRSSLKTKRRKSAVEQADERAAARAKRLAQQASSLGQRIKSEDAQFDVQLKAKFDHTIGTLGGGSVSDIELVPAAENSPASQIAAMLASPDGVRQAIVINEILRRPTDRW